MGIADHRGGVLAEGNLGPAGPIQLFSLLLLGQFQWGVSLYVYLDCEHIPPEECHGNDTPLIFHDTFPSLSSTTLASLMLMTLPLRLALRGL